MQQSIRKYNGQLSWRAIIILSVFLFINAAVNAQEDERANWTDTIKDLKYELDTSVVVLDTVVAKAPEEIGDEDYSEEEAKPEEEHFLRKEFTGGLPDTILFRRLSDRSIKALREDEAFWYANETFKKKQNKQKEENTFGAHPVFQTLLWMIIIGGFITFLVLYLQNSNAGLFRKSTSIAEAEIDVDTGDIFSINYQKEIDKAVAMNNYRLAVRLMFLRLLRNLSDKNIIQYQQDNTNFDYMMQLRSSNLYPDFFRLTRNYEYSWYGQFDVDNEKYSIIKKDFDNFERSLNT